MTSTAAIRTQDFEIAQAAILRHHGVAARSNVVAVTGGTAHVLVAGAGPPVVLVNGIGLPAAMWAPLLAHLDGFQVHAVDLPGFGLSIVDAGSTPDLAGRMTGFLTEVLDALSLERPTVVANSFGSWCVLRLAMGSPARVGATVHVGCPALLEPTSAPLPMRLLSLPLLGGLMDRLQPPSPRQVQQVGRLVGEAPLPDLVVDLLVSTARLPQYADAFRPTLHQLLHLRGARPAQVITRDALATVGTPTRFVWGTGDPFGSPSVGARAADVMPHADLRTVPGGHAPWLHHVDAVADQVLPFLHQHAHGN